MFNPVSIFAGQTVRKKIKSEIKTRMENKMENKMEDTVSRSSSYVSAKLAPMGKYVCDYTITTKTECGKC